MGFIKDIMQSLGFDSTQNNKKSEEEQNKRDVEGFSYWDPEYGDCYEPPSKIDFSKIDSDNNHFYT